MKRSFIIIVLLLVANISYASQKAITDTGEEIIIYTDGTWVYSNDEQRTATKIETSSKVFTRPGNSSFEVKSTKNNSIFWINTDKWTFTKQVENPAAEYEFKLKGKDLYGMAITEEIEIPLESLVELAIENARKIAPDIRITKQQYRVVNGKKVLYMTMSGTIQGMKASYLGYYYSDGSGTTQLLTYTATNLVEKYRSEIDDFLNGFGSR